MRSLHSILAEVRSGKRGTPKPPRTRGLGGSSRQNPRNPQLHYRPREVGSYLRLHIIIGFNRGNSREQCIQRPTWQRFLDPPWAERRAERLPHSSAARACHTCCPNARARARANSVSAVPSSPASYYVDVRKPLLSPCLLSHCPKRSLGILLVQAGDPFEHPRSASSDRPGRSHRTSRNSAPRALQRAERELTTFGRALSAEGGH